MAKTGRSFPLLRGNALATVDAAGRLKVPADFRRALARGWGGPLYLTSLLGDSALVYPLAVWEEKERRILALPQRHPAVEKFVHRTSYFGAEARIDGSGRVLLPPLLRAEARLKGEVAVLGALDHLEVWSNALFKRRLDQEPLSPEDRRVLAELKL